MVFSTIQGLDLLNKTALEDKSSDLFDVTFDMVGVIGQADVFHDRSAFEFHAARSLDVKILDQSNAIAFLQDRAIGVAYNDFIAHGLFLQLLAQHDFYFVTLAD